MRRPAAAPAPLGYVRACRSPDLPGPRDAPRPPRVVAVVRSPEMPVFGRVATAMATPFHADGSLDLDGLLP